MSKNAPAAPTAESRIDYAASANAPFVAFSEASRMGIRYDTATITLFAMRFLHPQRDAAGEMIGVEGDRVATAYLYGDLAAFRQLRQAIDEVERMFKARAEIIAAEGRAGASASTMQ